jgi:3-hydroxyisobutyrate dehydrogenase-like beta-hydroxyacid dehydrogenase
MRAAWIGLGHMGLPMAANVARAGHPLRVFDVRDAAAEPLVELGVAVGTSPADAARDAEVISVAVLDGPQVEAVMLGPDGVLAGARPGSVVAVHSTVHPATVHAVAEHAPPGVTVLDAPISGGVQGARAGTLCVMVGGPVAGFEQARPLLDAVGDLVLHLGERGAGLAAKLARNLIGYVSMLGAQEGRALADAAGTDPAAFAAILEHTGALSPMMRDLLSVPGGDDVYRANLGPLVELAAKDLRVTLDLGDELDVELPATAITLEHVAFSFGAQPDRGGR